MKRFILLAALLLTCTLTMGAGMSPPVIHNEPMPNESDVTILAKLIWGEARGVATTKEKAAVVWCVLNRVGDPRWGDTIAEVVTQKDQFTGYSPTNSATDEHLRIAADVLARWQLEKIGLGDAGRVLPAGYVFFSGNKDGTRNTFRTEYKGGMVWEWELEGPYGD